MTSTSQYVARFVDSFPTPLEPGVLYVSVAYSTAGHLCACGCGGEIVTKLSPARYRIIFDGEISLKPSISATALPCKSHYFITRGEVDWHRSLNDGEIVKAQAADRRALEVQRDKAIPKPPGLKWWKRWNRPSQNSK
ncbi:MAG: hypothetical protein JWN80_323 [Microbacteriaceae bacterium]|nr:hypothetical protein [Microbacteriaceae bacterium]